MQLWSLRLSVETWFSSMKGSILGTAMTFYVYLISSKDKKEQFHMLVTNDIKKRIRLHNNSKGAKFTKGRIWKLKYFKSYNSKDAMREEYKLKKNSKLRNILKD